MVKVLLFCALEAAVWLGGQRSGSPPETRDADMRVFRTYCAPCHGVTGRGDGPMAGELKDVPPDLTKYAERNRGVFPDKRLREIIDGRGITAHGNREMPVWGDAFRSAKEGLTPEAAQARIDAVVRYLAAIQQRAAE